MDNKGVKNLIPQFLDHLVAMLRRGVSHYFRLEVFCQLILWEMGIGMTIFMTTKKNFKEICR